MIEKDRSVPVGNYFDKYSSKNPLVRFLMNNFSSSLLELVRIANPRTIHDVGCGEGHWAVELSKRGFKVKASDFSSNVLGALPRDILFEEKNIYHLIPEIDSAELILCCEVLEHLEDPQKALISLQGIVTDHLILSVPREPVWRILNFMRGSYWRDLGNTPGHIQHWSKKKFIRLVSNYFEVVEVREPLPWTMLLCRPRKRS